MDGGRYEQRLRRHRDRRRLAGRALRRRARRGRPARRASSSASWSAASAPTGRASRRRRCCGPGEAVQGAREAAATAEVDVEAALAWRDFMVSDYSDAGQERWLADTRHRPAARQRPARRHRAPSRSTASATRPTTSSLANGAEPIIPPIPGLRELDGVWTNREATGMKAVPRRLLVLGGGPVGVEMAQAVRRLGGEVVLVERAEHVLPREPAPLGEALGEVAAPRRHRARARRGTPPPRGATATTTSWSSTTDASCAATVCSSPPAGARASTGSASRPSASTPDAARHPGRRAPARRRAPVGDRRRHRHLAADPRRQVPGPASSRRTSSASRARPTTRPSRASSTPTRRPRRSARAEARVQRDRSLSRRSRRPPPTRARTPSPTAS